MKSKFIFAGITVAMMPFAVLSCTDTGTEDDRPEAVNEIIDVLETSLPQASSFTDLLKDADLSDVVSDELTVFAVQDDTQEKSETSESSSDCDSVCVLSVSVELFPPKPTPPNKLTKR